MVQSLQSLWLISPPFIPRKVVTSSTNLHYVASEQQRNTDIAEVIKTLRWRLLNDPVRVQMCPCQVKLIRDFLINHDESLTATYQGPYLGNPFLRSYLDYGTAHPPAVTAPNGRSHQIGSRVSYFLLDLGIYPGYTIPISQSRAIHHCMASILPVTESGPSEDYIDTDLYLLANISRYTSWYPRYRVRLRIHFKGVSHNVRLCFTVYHLRSNLAPFLGLARKCLAIAPSIGMASAHVTVTHGSLSISSRYVLF